MIAICPNPFRDHELKLSKELDALLRSDGFETWICPVFADEEPEVLPEDLVYHQLKEIDETCTLAVVVGGDGTILAVVRALQGLTVPLLGINLGTKGFMTSLEPENAALVVNAARGERQLSHRMMLDVSLRRNGEIVYTDHALNDAVLHRRAR